MIKTKLLKLNPKFVDSTNRIGIALVIECPHCDNLIEIPFENPLDGQSPPPWPNLWKRTGDDFSNLTLDPEIYWEGHCHIKILNGEVFALHGQIARSKA